MPEPDIVVRLDSVNFSIEGKPIINNVSFKVHRRENFFILGSSGAGKSTILKLITGLLKPDSGKVVVLGEDLGTLSLKELNLLRHRIGFVFQYSALFDFLNVYDNVAFPLILTRKYSKEEVRKKVIGLLERLDLVHAMHLKPHELSGGMRKRVALARAVITEPELILYDEPTSGLDPIMSDVIDSMIVDFKLEYGVTNIVVTHDVQSAMKIADRIAFIHEGRLVFEGTPREALASDEKFVRNFLEKGFRGKLENF